MGWQDHRNILSHMELEFYYSSDSNSFGMNYGVFLCKVLKLKL